MPKKVRGNKWTRPKKLQISRMVISADIRARMFQAVLTPEIFPMIEENLVLKENHLNHQISVEAIKETKVKTEKKAFQSEAIEVFEMPLSNAVRRKNYHNRKKLKIKTAPKTSAERSRMYKLRKKQLAQGSKLSTNEVLCTRTTSNSQMTFEPLPQPVTTEKSLKIKEECLHHEINIEEFGEMEIKMEPNTFENETIKEENLAIREKHPHHQFSTEEFKETKIKTEKKEFVSEAIEVLEKNLKIKEEYLHYEIDIEEMGIKMEQNSFENGAIKGQTSTMEIKPMHSSLEPLKFLIGKWRSIEASGKFEPRIAPFNYCEELEFTSFGQPMLNYCSTSWHPENKNAMHLESGFLKIQPGTNKLSFIVAHNFGLTTIEEGTIVDNTIKLKTVNIARCSQTKEPLVTELTREMSLIGSNRLDIVVYMATIQDQGLKHHLSARYEKVV